jgi:hypothetical protein
MLYIVSNKGSINMVNSTIISLAILKVNWDTLGKDYLENFVPIISECIRISGEEIISIPSLQEQVKSNFGLRLPQNVIKTILIRLKNRGFIRIENKIFIRNLEYLNNLNFSVIQSQVIRHHDMLIQSLISFCFNKYGRNWTAVEAENAVISYLEDNQLIVINPETIDNVISDDGSNIGKGTKFIIASFIKNLYESKSSEFEYLETIIKGNMIANGIFLPNPDNTPKNFRKTKIYFDTPFLIYALGYAGQSREAPCMELLGLLYEAGADLKCFRHTVDEVRGVLSACSHRLASGQLRDAYGPSLDYFITTGYTASDIELFSIKLEDNLKQLKIDIVDKPKYKHEYVIDERLLFDMLDHYMSYSNIYALSRDVDSISAIMRLREGKECFSVEDCRAVFITTNSGLFRVACDYYYIKAQSHTIAPCLTDYTLTNLLWLKQPTKAPDLPRKRIIADCFATIQPSEKLYRKYLSEIDKLKINEQISNDDYFLLRHSLEAKSSLMEITLGEEEAFSL